MLLRTNFAVIEYPTSTPNYRLLVSPFGTQCRSSMSYLLIQEKANLTISLNITLRCGCQLTYSCYGRLDNNLPYCYKVHSHCWNWIKCIIGSVVEEHLNLLVVALRYRWKELPYEIDDLVDSAYEGHYHWMGERVPSACSFDPRAPGFVPYKTRVAPVTDLFHIPALQTLISRSRKRRNSTRMLTRASRSAEAVSRTRTSRLPLGIRQLILDELSDILLLGMRLPHFTGNSQMGTGKRDYHWM